MRPKFGKLPKSRAALFISVVLWSKVGMYPQKYRHCNDMDIYKITHKIFTHDNIVQKHFPKIPKNYETFATS